MKDNSNSIPRDSMQGFILKHYSEVSAYLEKASKQTFDYVQELRKNEKLC
jgi:hypothetical protein